MTERPLLALGAERVPRELRAGPLVLAARAAVHRAVPLFARVQVQVEKLGGQAEAARERPVAPPASCSNKPRDTR